jgi:hypothetical protein
MKSTSKIIGGILIAISATFSGFAQEKETVERKLESFTSVAVGGSMDVFLTEGDSEKARIEAEGIEIEKITTEVRNNELKIDIKDNNWWYWGKNVKIKVYLTYRNLNALSSSGSSDIIGNSVLKGENFAITVSGSGDIKAKLDVKNLNVAVSGSSDLTLNGVAEEQDISISGSGDFKGEDLKGKIVKVKVSGSGDAKVWAEESIEARVSGSGDIRYKGNPNKEISKVSGSGTIKRS